MPPKPVPVIDISVDFDFFCREDPDWLWDHAELPAHVPRQVANSLQEDAWMHRYMLHNLYKECDPAIYADFPPVCLIPRLMEDKGLRFLPPQQRHFANADSHRFAWDFFSQFSPPDIFLNIDTHHDLWPFPRPAGLGRTRADRMFLESEAFKMVCDKEGIESLEAIEKKVLDSITNCGNWHCRLFDHWNAAANRAKRPQTQFYQVYPIWKGLCKDTPAERPVSMTTWANLPPLNGRLRNLFLCRSSPWVPPHLDPQFTDLNKSIFKAIRHSHLRNTTGYEFFEPRNAPTLEANLQAIAHFQEAFASLAQMRDRGALPDLAQIAEVMSPLAKKALEVIRKGSKNNALEI